MVMMQCAHTDIFKRCVCALEYPHYERVLVAFGDWISYKRADLWWEKFLPAAGHYTSKYFIPHL